MNSCRISLWGGREGKIFLKDLCKHLDIFIYLFLCLFILKIYLVSYFPLGGRLRFKVHVSEEENKDGWDRVRILTVSPFAPFQFWGHLQMVPSQKENS